GIEERCLSSFLCEPVKADANIQNPRVRQRVCIVQVTAVVGSIFKTLGDGKVVYHAGPILPILRIKAVIVLSEDRLLGADPMIDARQPGPVVLMPNLIREEVVLRAIRDSRNIRQGIILNQRRSHRLEQAGWDDSASSR